MAPPVYKVKLTRPQVFLWRMTLFLILAVLLAIILDGQTQQLRHSFLANPGLNGLIIGVLIVGIVYAFRQVLRLYPEINWVNNFRISDPGITTDKTTPVLLAPMATMLRDRTGHLSLATGVDALAPRFGRLAARRAARDHPLSRRAARVSRPARHVLGLAADGELGRRHHRHARHQCRRERDAVRPIEGRSGRAAEGHGHGLLLLDVRSRRLADPGLPRSAGRPRARPLLQRARGLALGHHRAAAGRCRHGAAAVPPQMRFALLDMQRSLSDLEREGRAPACSTTIPATR